MGKAMRVMRRYLLALAAMAAVPQSAFADGGSVASFPVPTVTVRAGDVLSDDIVIERRLIANQVALRTHYTIRNEVVGKVARRPLAAGAAIPINALREPFAFKEGERVVVEYASGGLRIRAMAVALQPGIVGSSARARNVDTGVIVNGVVHSDGRIEVRG